VSPTPTDRELLRAYEPVLRFTAGELFLPTSVGPYVARCSLWVGGPDRATAPLVPAGELTLDGLAELGDRHCDLPLYCGSSSSSWTGARSGAGAVGTGRGCGARAGSPRSASSPD
jgi:hypothetical protein